PPAPRTRTASASAASTPSSAGPGVVPDVPAQLLALEVDEIGGAVGPLRRLVDVGADGRDGEHAPARRQQALALAARAGVADRDALEGGGGGDAGDLAPRLVGAGVAPRGEHDAQRG